MIILPVNSNPNIRNLSHNAYYDCIMSADEYTGDLIAVFAVQNEYEVKSRFSSYKKENGVYSVFQKEKYKIKIGIIEPVSEKRRSYLAA